MRIYSHIIRFCVRFKLISNGLMDSRHVINKNIIISKNEQNCTTPDGLQKLEIVHLDMNQL